MPTQRNSWVKPYVNAWVDHIKLFSCAYVRSRKKEKGVRKNVSWPRWLTLSYLLTTTFKRYATVDLCKSFPPSVDELSRGNVCIDQQTAPIPVVAPEAQSKKKEAPSLESWATHGFIKNYSNTHTVRNYPSDKSYKTNSNPGVVPSQQDTSGLHCWRDPRPLLLCHYSDRNKGQKL